MLIKTEAIVLGAIRYSDADLIVKLFTKKLGISSYHVRSVLKSKKTKIRPSFFLPFSILEIDAVHSPKANLNRLKEVKPQSHFKTLHSNVLKGTVVTFLAEILKQILVEEDVNEKLFEFLKTSFLWLDNNAEIALFHVLFLLKLTRYFGCYPDDSNANFPEFNLLEGRFDLKPSKYSITGRKLECFKLILGINFDDLFDVSLKKKEREHLLNTVLDYYQLHVYGFKSPKSLKVFQNLFN